MSNYSCRIVSSPESEAIWCPPMGRFFKHLDIAGFVACYKSSKVAPIASSNLLKTLDFTYAFEVFLCYIIASSIVLPAHFLHFCLHLVEHYPFNFYNNFDHHYSFSVNYFLIACLWIYILFVLIYVCIWFMLSLLKLCKSGPPICDQSLLILF